MARKPPSGVTTIVICAAVSCLVPGLAAHAQQPENLELTLVRPDGARETLAVLPPSVFAPRVSPDGSRVVFETQAQEEGSETPVARLWVAELDDIESRRSIPPVGGLLNWAAVWTADGEHLVFLASHPERTDTLYRQSADGTADGAPLIEARSAESWTPDGKQLTYLTLQGDGDYGISLLDVEAGDTSTVIDLPGSAEHSSHISPDGQWVAFASNETGRFEVWIAPLREPANRHRVTTDGGGHPLWSPDGGTLYFDRDQQLYELEIDPAADGGVEIGEARALPIMGFVQGLYRRQFDLLPDGTAFLMLFPPSSNEAR